MSSTDALSSLAPYLRVSSAEQKHPGSFHYGEERPRRRSAAPGDQAKWRSAAMLA
jgi:hypothetical protein